MENSKNILQDSFGRQHNYLRISLTELCNLRCTYCMPADGIQLSPKAGIMTYEEIYTISSLFVKHGVTKIRLTGGEPLVRNDADIILKKLATLPVELAISTNAVSVERFIDTFKSCGINNINVSLDSLNEKKFNQITRRKHFQKVFDNIHLLIAEGFKLKLNVVLMKGVNDDEILDFIALTKDLPVAVRFIEFMPFEGNKWNLEKMVSFAEIMATIGHDYEENKVLRLTDSTNDTSKNYKIQGYQGSFGIISSVTNPFCDTCNRIRLTANGRIKNCLFSATESDLLSPLREGKNIEPIIKQAVQSKLKIRGGMDTLEKLQNPDLHSQNRSMIAIGG